MIFGRRKRAQEPDEDVEPDEATPSTQDAPAAGDASGASDAAEDHDAAAGDQGDLDDGSTAGEADEALDGDSLDVDGLDAQEWRTDGPFDVHELHDEDAEQDDQLPRIDLGSLVLTALPGSELRLQVTEETQEIISAMLVLESPGPQANGSGQPSPMSSSALELSVYAAPRSGGLWAELRDDISASATEAGGSSSLAQGPFGVELRRLIPVTTPDGEQGYQPSRMWVAEGPRWLLRGIVYGQAAIEDDADSPAVARILAAFRAVVVRRGDEAMAPGDPLPLTMPADLTPAE